MKIDMFGPLLVLTLKMIGLWPDYSNIFLTVLATSGIITTVPFQWWYLTKIYDDPLALTDNLGTVLPLTLLTLKLIVMWLNKRHIVDFFREMAEDYEKKEIVQKWSASINYSRNFCKYDYGMYMVTCIVFYLQAIGAYIQVPKEDRALVYMMDYPFEYKHSPIYEIVISMQIVQTFFLGYIYAMSESLLVAMVLHVCGHIDLLLDEIDLLSQNLDTTASSRNLESLIKKHIKVLDTMNKLDVMYTYITLLQVIFSSAIICILGYILMNVGFDEMLFAIKYSLVVLVIGLQIYCFCFAGQHLINKSDEILHRLCNIPWYNVKPSEVRALMFVIGRAQYPLSLTAGNFLEISAETFTGIMRTAFSYLSVLRARLRST